MKPNFRELIGNHYVDKSDLQSFAIQLQEKTSFVINIAKTRMDEFDGDAVNWADLDCIDACVGVDIRGNLNLKVFISEASPEGCPQLRKFIRSALIVEYPEIEVITEW
jgi:hypothetical protein